MTPNPQDRKLPTGGTTAAITGGMKSQEELAGTMPPEVKAGYDQVAEWMLGLAQLQASDSGPDTSGLGSAMGRSGGGGNLLLAGILRQAQMNGSGGGEGGAAGGIPGNQYQMNPGELTPEVIGLPIPSKPWPPKDFDYDKASPEERAKYMSPLEQNTYKMQLKNVRDWFKKDANPKTYEKTWKFSNKKRLLDGVAKSKAGIFSFLAELYISFMDTKTRAYDAFYMIYYKDRVLKPMYAPHKVAGDMWKKMEEAQKAAKGQDGTRGDRTFELAGLLGMNFGGGVDQQNLGLLMGAMQGMAADQEFGKFMGAFLNGQHQAGQGKVDPSRTIGPTVQGNLSPDMQQRKGQGLTGVVSSLRGPADPSLTQLMTNSRNTLQSHLPANVLPGSSVPGKRPPTLSDINEQIARAQLDVLAMQVSVKGMREDIRGLGGRGGR